MEVAPFTLANSVTEISAAERSRLREVASRTGIKIIGIHWVLVKPEGLYINHPDSQIRERTSDYFCELVDFCADLGGSRMVVGSPKQRNVLPNVSFEQARDWAIDTFSDAVARAEERKVTICFEPLGPSETNFINSAAEAIAFVRRLPSPYFQIILDVKAMTAEPVPKERNSRGGRYNQQNQGQPPLRPPHGLITSGAERRDGNLTHASHPMFDQEGMSIRWPMPWF